MAKNKFTRKIRENIDIDKKTCNKAMNTLADISAYYYNLKQLGTIENPVGNMQMQLRMVTDALNMKVQVLGEEMKNFSDDFKTIYLDGVDLNKFVKVRNLISHQYEAVNMKVVKGLVEIYLPDIQYGIEMFKKDVNENNPYNINSK